ncbi:hypothetical protein DPEC_G00051500 [Dallia pectoralis]|uniref:Uncharacterized protein n=1 Tax=Dallia pectoralis TaxID=75939 RepID=A0ACC2HBA4_DALPE|nr:hypothetical protein DPEC_G00051500 [Dallia pectoralis]
MTPVRIKRLWLSEESCERRKSTQRCKLLKDTSDWFLRRTEHQNLTLAVSGELTQVSEWTKSLVWPAVVSWETTS